MKQPKLCRECEDARFFDTGSSLFFVCRRTGEMRTYHDVCNILITGVPIIGNNDTLLHIFNELFVNRRDSYAVQQPDGRYFRVEQPLTLEVLSRHLKGEITVGAYQLDTNNYVKDTVFDLDPEKLEDPKRVAQKIIEVCLAKPDGVYPRVWQKALLLEASRHPDPSYHVYIFFEPKFPAKAARWLGYKILELANLNPKLVEIFPKQNELTEDRPYGNFVKFPLGKHRQAEKWSKFLGLENFKPLPRGVLHEVEGITFSEYDTEKILNFKGKRDIQTKFDLPKSFKPLPDREEQRIVKLLANYWREGYRNQLCMAFLGWCLKKGISYESAYRIVDTVTTATNDEEKRARLDLVRYHYKNRRDLNGQLKGSTGIKEIIRQVIKR